MCECMSTVHWISSKQDEREFKIFSHFSAVLFTLHRCCSLRFIRQILFLQKQKKINTHQHTSTFWLFTLPLSCLFFCFILNSDPLALGWSVMCNTQWRWWWWNFALFKPRELLAFVKCENIYNSWRENVILWVCNNVAPLIDSRPFDFFFYYGSLDSHPAAYAVPKSVELPFQFSSRWWNDNH